MKPINTLKHQVEITEYNLTELKDDIKTYQDNIQECTRQIEVVLTAKRELEQAIETLEQAERAKK